MKENKRKPSRKQIAIAVAVAIAIVLPWMVFGGDVRTGAAEWHGPSIADYSDTDIAVGILYPLHFVQRLDCWWDVFCLGFCDC